ncbi:hypothetical protein [Dinghuibacter silviterrae]|uniref:Uncharacterized protein n=1 Tax=Dinghuibacter silviterrae TaxID=1539049 RepID=A0A4R8DG48_9BACT|nr:hypothetical protein [Dinghuibacter silviterrae]TDW96601.1 hypothetical protein EDB95_4434 [Dinghuibacter silviterrae]
MSCIYRKVWFRCRDVSNDGVENRNLWVNDGSERANSGNVVYGWENFD